MTVETTLYGPKIVTDMSHCVSDGACAKVKACPSFEEVIVTRKQAQGSSGAEERGRNSQPPSPPAPLLVSDPFHIFTAGVGGQGAGVVSAVLVHAAHLEGDRVLFSDKKGLAIRNGGVYAH